MHGQYSQAYYSREQQFNDKFPAAIVAILAVIQMLTTFGIVALEIGHIIINIRITNLFVGIWTSVPFTILWISMFAAVCCCRRRSCAIHAVIQNCISLAFASALIGINIAFLRRPYHCFFSEGICDNLSWTNSISLPIDCLDDQSNNCENTRLALIKAQLGAGVLMAATCFTYLILYCAVASRVSRTDRRQIPAVTEAVMAPVHQHQSYTNPPHFYQPSAPVMMPTYQQASLGITNANYIPPSQYPTIYPQIPHDRF